MKTTLIITSFTFVFALLTDAAKDRPLHVEPLGAWQLETQNGELHPFSAALLIKDGYIFYTEYDVEKKHFEGSLGGQYAYNDGTFDYTIEFDTWQTERIGMTINANIKIAGDKLTVTQNVGEEESVMVFSRIDDATGDLAGAWRITQRMRQGAMTAMRQGPRKTIKMITGTRFQWAAFNPETKQFSGTGGGSITLEDGTYTEHIEFFSRNKDRVGASLTFDYKVDGINWDHSGMSSSGNPIREIWTRQNQ